MLMPYIATHTLYSFHLMLPLPHVPLSFFASLLQFSALFYVLQQICVTLIIFLFFTSVSFYVLLLSVRCLLCIPAA